MPNVHRIFAEKSKKCKNNLDKSSLPIIFKRTRENFLNFICYA
jgi:hypothetical protein